MFVLKHSRPRVYGDTAWQRQCGAALMVYDSELHRMENKMGSVCANNVQTNAYLVRAWLGLPVGPGHQSWPMHARG